MADVRRRLRDVSSRVSGVLGALRDEVAPLLASDPEPDPEPEPGAEPAPGPVGETGQVPAADTAPETTSDPIAGAAEDAAPAAGPGAVELDQACAAAVETARAAAVDEGGRRVGDHLGVQPDGEPGEHVATHSFACTDPAYRGWHWAVTVARAEGSQQVTVDEVVLLPGAQALLAPAWVPYAERVQPQDLSPGDLLPPAPEDPRLVPAYADTDPPDGADGPDGAIALAQELFWELGLGRPRVLSALGRLAAAERWHDGEAGPHSPRAQTAPGPCGTCGFLVPLGGALRRAFGVCANGQAPDDGRVVALDHGCGAHSEQRQRLTHVPTAGLASALDDLELEVRDVRPADPLPGPADEQQAEQLGHS